MASSEAARYWAFISYSHADRSVARWLHRALETYRIPKALIGTSPAGIPVPKNLFPIFRDQEDLSSSSSLNAGLQGALRRSEFLIVVASQQSAQSRWVNEEIRTFKAMGRSQRVLCVIADGEPFASTRGEPERECFPPALRFEVDADGTVTDRPEEPIAADLRPGRDGKRDARLKLVAGMLGLELNALRRRDLQRRNRFMTAVSVAAVLAATFTTGLSIVAIRARDDARAQRLLADARREQAEGMIQFMLGDLRAKLEPLGKLDLLDAIGDQAMSYFGAVNASALSEAELSSRAKALRQIGDVRLKQGRLEKAAPVFEEAAKLDQELVSRHPQDDGAIFDFAQSAYYVGYAAYLNADYAKARTWFTIYSGQADRLISLAPEKLTWQMEAIYARHNLAGVDRIEGQYKKAAAAYQENVEVFRMLLKANPRSIDTLKGLSESEYAVAVCLQEIGEFQKALRYAVDATTVAEQLVAQKPVDYLNLLPLARYLTTQATLEVGQSQGKAAIASIDRAVSLAEELVKRDASNAQFRRAYAAALDGRATVALALNRLSQARSDNRDAREVVDGLLKQTAELDYARRLATNVFLRDAELNIRDGERAAAAKSVDRAADLWRDVSEDDAVLRRFRGRIALYQAELQPAVGASSGQQCPHLAIDPADMKIDHGIGFGLALIGGDRHEATQRWSQAQSWIHVDPSLSGLLKRWCERHCTSEGWSPCGGS